MLKFNLLEFQRKFLVKRFNDLEAYVKYTIFTDIDDLLIGSIRPLNWTHTIFSMRSAQVMILLLWNDTIMLLNVS